MTGGDAIITEGETGHEFFVVESGEYRVTQLRNGAPVEVHYYEARLEGAHPSFGEVRTHAVPTIRCTPCCTLVRTRDVPTWSIRLPLH